MQLDWENLTECLSNIIVSIAAIATTFAAWRGLQTWRQEIQGKAKYESARQLYRAVLQWRHEIEDIRSSVQILRKDDVAYIEENEGNPMHYLSHNPAEKRQAERLWYDSRWRAIDLAIKEIQLAEIEVEVVLGSQPLRDVQMIYQLTKELAIAIRRATEAGGVTDSETRERVDQVLYKGYPGDGFTERVDKTVEKIRDNLVSYLGRR